jgi:hypothetical protein
MTADDFRRIALELPEATEGAHMNHPDFRVRGRIFATLWPSESRGVVMLTPEQQSLVTKAVPAVFEPVPGGWGRKGSTSVHLRRASEKSVRDALLKAWRNKAPDSLVDE